MNRSKQRAVEIFHQLNSRLRSGDEKSQSKIRDEVGDDQKKKKKRNEDSPPDNQTSSTAITMCSI